MAVAIIMKSMELVLTVSLRIGAISRNPSRFWIAKQIKKLRPAPMPAASVGVKTPR